MRCRHAARPLPHPTSATMTHPQRLCHLLHQQPHQPVAVCTGVQRRRKLQIKVQVAGAALTDDLRGWGCVWVSVLVVLTRQSFDWLPAG